MEKIERAKSWIGRLEGWGYGRGLQCYGFTTYFYHAYTGLIGVHALRR